MHITHCLHPKKIRNPYTHEIQIVSCGKCSACRNMKAAEWVERLNQERYCWHYCWFFTLTYSPDNVPILEHSSGIIHAKDLKHVSKDGTYPFIDTSALYPTFSPRQVVKCQDFLQKYSQFYYLSKYDVQCFMKRLRINLKRLHEKNNYGKKTDSKVRYFICGEYGPKGQPPRPHYHGLLFFNSELTASRISEIISKSWQLGFVNSSPVSETNSDYVARYLNCTSHLPKIFEHPSIRPFCLSSKQPPIGTLCHNTQEIRRIFDSCNPSHIILNHKQGIFENVRLWRTYQDSLFPKLSYFSELSHSDRVILYRVFEKVDRQTYGWSSANFWNYCKSTIETGSVNFLRLSSVVLDYARTLLKSSDTPYPIQRWYNISSRVCEQARSFGISVSDYVRHIEEFFDNVEKLKICEQFQFEQDFANKYPVEQLLGLDPLFLMQVSSQEIYNLSAEEITILENYNIDFNAFFNQDSAVRKAYIDSLLPSNTLDYLCFKIDNEVIQRNNCKTKEKNEFINENIFGAF